MSIEYPQGFCQAEMRRKPICGVLSVAICAGVSYEVAHAACKRNMLQHQKRFGGKTYGEQQLAALDDLAVKYSVVDMIAGAVYASRLHWLIEHKFKAGSLYMVTVRGHVVTVKDGVICDQGQIRDYNQSSTAKRKVIRYVEILGKGW